MTDVMAPLHYLAPQSGPLETWSYDSPDGRPRFNGRLTTQLMRIEDARDVPGGTALDQQGFQLVQHRLAAGDLTDDEVVTRQVYPEAEALVRALTGAPFARAFDHTRRQREPHKPPLDGTGGSFSTVRTPVGRVHADYTPLSAPRRLKQVLGEAGATSATQGRYLIIGLWRPLLERPLQDAPLTWADARSVQRSDLVTNDLIYPERRGQTYAVVHRSSHRWYWFPAQTRGEVVAFVHYDSNKARAATAGVAPHTAFENPLAPSLAPPRISLEMRIFAWFSN